MPLDIVTDINFIGEWTAIDRNTYDCDCDQDGFFSTSPVGTGKTEQEAIDDLREQIAEREIYCDAAPADAAVSYETKTPTAATYGDLNRAYAFFNERLFGNRLPSCLITLQRHKGAYGYFSPERFASKAGEIVDEIALNPQHFTARSARETLSTLVHEMTHLEQQHFGKPSRKGYHNKQWATFMKAVGLHPSDTAAPGGKETGQFVSHYIIEGGAYDVAFVEFEKHGFTDLFGDHCTESDDAKKKRKKKNASKSPFVCEDCELKAWAKRDASLWCGECQQPMVCTAEDDDSEGED
jgi:hypothetical protein